MGDPSLTLAMAMFFGIIAQAMARHLRVPGIVVVLATGVALGPDGVGLIEPQVLGDSLHAFVGFAVAVILFEGGLHMDIKRLRQQARPIRRLVTVGALVTAIGATLAAKLAMGWDWRLSILFGTLVIVTGPTVITPLIRQMRLEAGLGTILEAEGIFIDAVGATIAVVALEVALVPSGQSLIAAVPDLVYRIGVGAAVGLAGGLAVALLLRRRRVIPEGLENTLALASAVAVYQLSNHLVHESGITAAIAAGMVLSNSPSHAKVQLVEFKEQLTVLLVATLFVLLAADVRLADVRALGWPGVVTVAALMLVVRPVTVFASTHGTGLRRREKLFLSWLAPRGIVAAAVASLFAIRLAEASVAGGVEMRALVFLVIASTVVIQGLSGGLVAWLLGVRRAGNVGFLVLGANPLARLVAESFRTARSPVVVVDSNREACDHAARTGLEIINGNGLDEEVMARAQADARIACIALTPNEHINYVFARKLRDHFRRPAAFVALEPTTDGVTRAMVDRIDAAVLFAAERDLTAWIRWIDAGSVDVERWALRTSPAAGWVSMSTAPGQALLPLAVRRDRRAVPVGDRTRLRLGDRIDLAIQKDHRGEAHNWLRASGFVPEGAARPATDPADRHDEHGEGPHVLTVVP